MSARRPPLAGSALLLLLLLACALSGCPTPNPSPVDASVESGWGCPPGWGPTQRGGCGPLTLLCADGGGAAPGACNDASAPQQIPEDGGSYTVPYVDPSGALRGGWREPGAVGGPPALDFAPDAGVGAPDADFTPDAARTACPSPWTLDPAGYCVPATPASPCPAGASPLPDGTCTLTTCAASDWPTLLPSEASRAVYARAGATGGDGTRDRPLGTLHEALALAGPAGVVALAEGTYDESAALEVRDGRTLVGLCAARTVLRGSAAGALLRVTGGTLALRGVGVQAAGLEASNAPLRLEGVRVEGASTALLAHGAQAQVQGTDVVLTGSRVTAAGEEGLGALVSDGATLTLERSSVTAMDGIGLYAAGDTSLTNCAFSDLGRSARVQVPIGINAVGARLSLERVSVATLNGLGVDASAGATVTMRDVLVRDVRARVVGTGYGVFVDTSATLDAVGLAVVNTRQYGVLVDSATVTLEQSAVVGTRAGVDPGNSSSGLRVERRGTLTVRGSLLLDNAVLAGLVRGVAPGTAVLRVVDSLARSGAGSSGVFAAAGTSRIELEGSRTEGSGGLVAYDAPAQVSATGSVLFVPNTNRAMNLTAVQAQDGGHALVLRSRLQGSVGRSGQAVGRDTLLELQDSVLEGLRADVRGTSGALASSEGARIVARGVAVRASEGVAFVALGGGVTEVSDSTVRTPLPAEAAAGAGFALPGGRLQLQRVSADCVASCLLAFEATSGDLSANGEGSPVLVVEDSVFRSLPMASGPQAGGVVAQSAAQLDLRRVLLRGSRVVGILLRDEGTVARLEQCVVEETQPSWSWSGQSTVDGRGLAVENGATLDARGLLVRGAHNLGAGIVGEGTRVVLRDALFQNTQPYLPGDFYGRALGVEYGATLDAAGLAVEGASEVGIYLYRSAPSRIADLLLRGVRPSSAGFGFGVMVSGNARLDLLRAALVDVAGVGIAAQRFVDARAMPGDLAEVHAQELYLRGVRPSSLQAPNGVPSSNLAAYGVSVGADTSLEAQHATILDAQYGFFASAGALTLRGAVLAGHSVARGARNNAQPTLVDVSGSGNASEELRVEATLPEAAALSEPTALCVTASCP